VVDQCFTLLKLDENCSGKDAMNCRCYAGVFFTSKSDKFEVCFVQLSVPIGNAKLHEQFVPIMEQKPPFPPFTLETAIQKVQAAEDAWNSKDPHRVSLAYTIDTEWRNRDLFIRGREEVKEFLIAKWAKELDYKLRKELWAFMSNRIAVRFEYEWHNEQGQWFRSYGNENWEFNENGLMQKRFASINDVPILEADRKL
jgi:nuclear transport factor 2 (NTF2) superfamily protein